MRKKNPLIISAVKTSVGHTESAAGLTGLLRLIGTNMVAKNLHFKMLNSFIGPALLEKMVAIFPLEVKRHACAFSYLFLRLRIQYRQLRCQMDHPHAV